MKRLIIVILVLAVIGVAFYFGYLKLQNKKGLELRTAETNQPIQLDIQPAPSGTPGFSVSGSNFTRNIKGTLSLESLFKNLFMNDQSVSWNSYYLDVNPEVGKRKYQMNLSFPMKEPALNVIDSLGKELGFTTQISETTMQFYHAVRNDKPIAFAISQPSNSSSNSISPNNLLRFKNSSFDHIFSQYKSYGIFIEDETGITDKFDGEILLDKNNTEATKTELQTKAGIDLIPFDKTVKLIKIY